MSTTTILVLGSHVYLPPDTDGPWQEVPFADIGEVATIITSGTTAKRIKLIYESSQLATDEVEVPKASRAVLRQIPDLRDRHAALAADHLGWSFQPPWQAGGRSSTLLHTEGATGLLTLVERLSASGVEVEGAWPATSLFFGRSSGSAASIILGETEAFIYIESRGQRIPIKMPGGVKSDAFDFWYELRGRLESYGLLDAHRGIELTVLSNIGDVATIASSCEWWSSIGASARITVDSLDTLPKRADKLRKGGNDNLMAAFPQPFDATPIFQVVTILMILSSIASAGYSFYKRYQTEQLYGIVSGELGNERNLLAQAQARKDEQDRLLAMYDEDVAVAAPSRSNLLRALGAVLPPSLSCSEFEVGRDGTVRMAGVAWQIDPSANKSTLLDPLIQKLQESDAEFVADTEKTQLDTDKGTWSIAGRLLSRNP